MSEVLTRRPGPGTSEPAETGLSAPLRLCVASSSGAASSVWVIKSPPGADRTIWLGPERSGATLTYAAGCGGWRIELPDDTAAEHGLPSLPAPAFDHRPGRLAPGWHVGLVLLVPVFALAPDAAPGGARITTVPAPPAGRCVQVTVLLSEPDAAEPATTALPEAKSLLRRAAGVQIWKDQLVLPPTVQSHLIRTRQHLVEIAPQEPRQLPAFTRFRTTDGVEVVADLGWV